MSFKVEDHYELRKHLHVDHNMIFYEARKSSCVECHSGLKITTTWKTYSGWPWHDISWREKKFMCWMPFKVKDHYDLRKHLHVDHNMIFYDERKSSCDECHTKLKTTTTWENTCMLTITWFFYEEQKSSCVECHSELKTSTTWENTATLTITWFFMKSK